MGIGFILAAFALLSPLGSAVSAADSVRQLESVNREARRARQVAGDETATKRLSAAYDGGSLSAGSGVKVRRFRSKKAQPPLRGGGLPVLAADAPAAPPVGPVKNATPYQSLIDKATKLITIAGLLLTVAVLLKRSSAGFAIKSAKALAYAAAAMAVAIIAIGVSIIAKKQYLQGAMFTVTGATLLHQAWELGDISGDLKKLAGVMAGKEKEAQQKLDPKLNEKEAAPAQTPAPAAETPTAEAPAADAPAELKPGGDSIARVGSEPRDTLREGLAGGLSGDAKKSGLFTGMDDLVGASKLDESLTADVPQGASEPSTSLGGAKLVAASAGDDRGLMSGVDGSALLDAAPAAPTPAASAVKPAAVPAPPAAESASTKAPAAPDVPAPSAAPAAASTKTPPPAVDSNVQTKRLSRVEAGRAAAAQDCDGWLCRATGVVKDTAAGVWKDTTDLATGAKDMVVGAGQKIIAGNVENLSKAVSKVADYTDSSYLKGQAASIQQTAKVLDVNAELTMARGQTTAVPTVQKLAVEWKAIDKAVQEHPVGFVIRETFVGTLNDVATKAGALYEVGGAVIQTGAGVGGAVVGTSIRATSFALDKTSNLLGWQGGNEIASIGRNWGVGVQRDSLGLVLGADDRALKGVRDLNFLGSGSIPSPAASQGDRMLLDAITPADLRPYYDDALTLQRTQTTGDALRYVKEYGQDYGGNVGRATVYTAMTANVLDNAATAVLGANGTQQLVGGLTTRLIAGGVRTGQVGSGTLSFFNRAEKGWEYLGNLDDTRDSLGLLSQNVPQLAQTLMDPMRAPGALERAFQNAAFELGGFMGQVSGGSVAGRSSNATLPVLSGPARAPVARISPAGAPSSFDIDLTLQPDGSYAAGTPASPPSVRPQLALPAPQTVLTAAAGPSLELKGTLPSLTPTVQPGRVLSDQGSTGPVLESTLDGKPVAVKVWNESNGPGDRAYFENEIANGRKVFEVLGADGMAPRFYGEVKVQGQDNLALAMEVVRGKSLDSLTPREAVEFITPSTVRQVASGVDRLAQAGLGGADSPQFMVITQDGVTVNGIPKRRGDVVFIDAGALRGDPSNWASPRDHAASALFFKRWGERVIASDPTSAGKSFEELSLPRGEGPRMLEAAKGEIDVVLQEPSGLPALQPVDAAAADAKLDVARRVLVGDGERGGWLEDPAFRRDAGRQIAAHGETGELEALLHGVDRSQRGERALDALRRDLAGADIVVRDLGVANGTLEKTQGGYRIILDAAYVRDSSPLLLASTVLHESIHGTLGLGEVAAFRLQSRLTGSIERRTGRPVDAAAARRGLSTSRPLTRLEAARRIDAAYSAADRKLWQADDRLAVAKARRQELSREISDLRVQVRRALNARSEQQAKRAAARLKDALEKRREVDENIARLRRFLGLNKA